MKCTNSICNNEFRVGITYHTDRRLHNLCFHCAANMIPDIIGHIKQAFGDKLAHAVNAAIKSGFGVLLLGITLAGCMSLTPKPPPIIDGPPPKTAESPRQQTCTLVEEMEIILCVDKSDVPIKNIYQIHV